MASWKKYFTTVNHVSNSKSTKDTTQSNFGSMTNGKHSSFLPEVYVGAPNRIERYVQYEQMDLDPEINKGLDIISDYSVQNYESGKQEPFEITYKDTSMTDTEVKVLREMLIQWCSLNRWQQRLWRMFRNIIKYGDQIYIRDPETFKLIWIDPSKLDKIIVNESKGKEIEQYVIRDVDINLKTLVGSNMLVHDQYSYPGGYPRPSAGSAGSGSVNYGASTAPGSRNSRFDNTGNQMAINAINVLHLSLSEGLDSQWPFGTSLLESIYKPWKQKDLLEDCILIYRIIRAPERRVFYIDTGSMQGPRAQAVVDRMKNEMYQRRMPNRSGGGNPILDASYSPLSINEDYFLATNSEGKGTRIETLPGGENLGQIDDLRYFNNKLIRGLGIPSSYLPTGPEDSSTMYNDGKVGTSYVQEFRFSKYCQRLQNLIAPTLDHEFKLYLKFKDVRIDSNSFELQFWEPQNFSQYKQMAVDVDRINLFTSLINSPAGSWISKRYAASKYLGWSQEDILNNESQWMEENPTRVKDRYKSNKNDSSTPDLSSVGITPTSVTDSFAATLDTDFNIPEDNEAPAAPYVNVAPEEPTEI